MRLLVIYILLRNTGMCHYLFCKYCTSMTLVSHKSYGDFTISYALTHRTQNSDACGWGKIVIGQSRLACLRRQGHRSRYTIDTDDSAYSVYAVQGQVLDELWSRYYVDRRTEHVYLYTQYEGLGCLI